MMESCTLDESMVAAAAPSQAAFRHGVACFPVRDIFDLLDLQGISRPGEHRVAAWDIDCGDAPAAPGALEIYDA